MEEENTVKEEEQQPEVKKHKPFKRYIFAGVLVLLAVGGGFFIHDILNYQSTDDAYVETTTVQVAPRVSGQITDVYITDNQPVTEGMLVAKIDDADYKAIYEEEKAKYERVLLNQKNAKAVFAAAQTKIDVAKKDLDRYTNLYAQGAVSKQTLDNAQAAESGIGVVDIATAVLEPRPYEAILDQRLAADIGVLPLDKVVVLVHAGIGDIDAVGRSGVVGEHEVDVVHVIAFIGAVALGVDQRVGPDGQGQVHRLGAVGRIGSVGNQLLVEGIETVPP